MSEHFEKTAIKKFAERVAVPLFEYSDSADGVRTFQGIGTATLISHASRLFLVTSDHVLEGSLIDRIAIPNRHDGKSDLFTLGKVRVTRPVDSFLDVAVLEILSERTDASLRQGWTIISSGMTADCPPAGSFLLLGYPTETRNLNPSNSDVEHVPLAILTDRLPATPEDAIDNAHREPIFGDVDLFFAHHKTGKDDDGSEKLLPNLKGMSGSTVWWYRPAAPNQIWLPETHLRAVGIQSGFIANSYIRAKSWRWAMNAITHAIAENAPE